MEFHCNFSYKESTAKQKKDWGRFVRILRPCKRPPTVHHSRRIGWQASSKGRAGSCCVTDFFLVQRKIDCSPHNHRAASAKKNCTCCRCCTSVALQHRFSSWITGVTAHFRLRWFTNSPVWVFDVNPLYSASRPKPFWWFMRKICMLFRWMWCFERLIC